MTVKTFSRQTVEGVQAQAILRWRWVILLASMAFVATVELLEHQALEIALAREFLVYGLVVPISIWILLTVLAHHIARQVALANELDQQRQFSWQLAYYHDRDELTDFMTRFPATLLPVEHVALFQYDHLKAQLEFVEEWNADGQIATPADRAPVMADAQYILKLRKASGLHEACARPLQEYSTDRRAGRQFCLPLVCDNVLVGLMQLQCTPDQTLSDKQIQFLNSVASHLALALALSIAFPRQVTEAQRSERRRLAYELHDSLAQQIGYLHLGLDRLADDDRLENVTWLQAELDRLREVASESYLHVRHNLSLLRTEEATDLVSTIENFIRSLGSHTLYQIEFHTSGTAVPLGPLATQHILGLIQESLNNAQKHAQAQRVQIELQWHADHLDVNVTDDGTGFDVAAAPETGQYGLTMLRERIQELHAAMRITSASGTGTALQFKIPLRT